jgi:hypothetical protein
VDHNRTATNLLILAVVIDYPLITAVFVLFPDLDPESVGLTIPGPKHELVVTGAVDSARSFELGSGTALIHYQPLIAAAVEIQIRRFEDELGIAGRDTGALLVL